MHKICGQPILFKKRDGFIFDRTTALPVDKAKDALHSIIHVLGEAAIDYDKWDQRTNTREIGFSYLHMNRGYVVHITEQHGESSAYVHSYERRDARSLVADLGCIV